MVPSPTIGLVYDVIDLFPFFYLFTLSLSFPFLLFFICNMKVKKAKTQTTLYYISRTRLQGLITKQTLKEEMIELNFYSSKQKIELK